MDRFKRKGGSMHAGMKDGVVVHINGEDEPIQLVKGNPDYEPPNKRPDVIYL